MLTHWGQRNHTVTELFKHLYALKNFQAMDVIKDCVPEKYHVHLKVICAKTERIDIGGPMYCYATVLSPKNSDYEKKNPEN